MSAETSNQNQQPAASAANPQAAPPVPASPQTTPPSTAAPQTVWPNPLAHLSVPFHGVDYSLRGYHADASIDPDKVVWAAEHMDREGFALDTITGVDWIAEGKMEVVYDFFHPVKPLRAVLRTRVSRETPEVPTISKIFPGANWHERETHDFFGIRFLGHPMLVPFLLPEDATYHPLRKDFTS